MIDDFLANIEEEAIGGRVYGVTEHEILEDHYAFARGHLIKSVYFVLPAAPDS